MMDSFGESCELQLQVLDKLAPSRASAPIALKGEFPELLHDTRRMAQSRYPLPT